MARNLPAGYRTTARTEDRDQLPVYTTALFPARTELLDAAADRLAVLRELPNGEVVIEARMLKRTPR